MQHSVTQDSVGTHISWMLSGVNAKMIDWFWSNMEKCFLLWHPSEHEPLTWEIPPSPERFIGAVHLAPQTWSDGRRQNLYIRFEDLETLPTQVKQYICYEHCVVVAGLGFGEESLNTTEPMGYRLHQWQNNGVGVVGKSSGMGLAKPETPEQGLVWAKHCIEEIGNWEVFLAQLFGLYHVVKNPAYNIFHDLSLKKSGLEAEYAYLKKAQL